MSETRNELLHLLHYITSDSDKDVYLEMLLERFDIDLKRKKDTLENELKQVKEDMETLEFVKTKLNEYYNKEEDL